MAKKKIHNEESDGTVTVILKIDTNCKDCAEKAVKYIRSLDDVETVENDGEKILVVGKVDPAKLRKNVEKKIRKKVELISPEIKNKKGDGEEKNKQQPAAVEGEDKHNKKKIHNEVSDRTVTVILKIDTSCKDCAEKAVKYIRSLDDVETVENEGEKITVIGKVNPAKLCKNVEKKIRKKVELISPEIKNKNGGGQEENKHQTAAVEGEDKHKKFPVTTTVLKVPLHCQGCIKKIQKLVRKTEGFVEMSIDNSNDLVTVKGAMDINMLTVALNDKLKKKAEIVPPKGGGGKKAAKGGGGDGDGKGKGSGGGGPTVPEYNHRMGYFIGQGQGQGQYMYPQYVYRPEYAFNYGHATQMFNDENPNACVVM